MGSLRTLFALSVVFAHTTDFVFVGGRNAVQLFYVISGFLISYVLVEKKAYPRVRDFYVNRYLRLYPVYAVVALLTIALYMSTAFAASNPDFLLTYRKAPAAAIFLLVVSNVLIFFQDWVVFSGVAHDQLVFSTNFQNSDVLLWQGLVVPQAWTLGVELSFYLIAPFVLTRLRLVLLLVSMSFLLRFLLIWQGLGRHDPWTYRFFPTELGLFLLGTLAHQVLLPRYRLLQRRHLDMAAAAATYFLLLLSAAYWLIPVREIFRMPILFLLFWIMMPLAFIFQSANRWDRWLGDLSYPIYICHMLVIMTVIPLVSHLGLQNKVCISVVCALTSIALAIILNRFVASPFEKVRDAFRSRAKAIRRPPTLSNAGL